MKMDYFKTDISTKEFKTLTEEIFASYVKMWTVWKFFLQVA